MFGGQAAQSCPLYERPGSAGLRGSRKPRTGPSVGRRDFDRMPFSEERLMRKLRTALASSSGRHGSVRLGIGDDAALFSPARGHDSVASCDWFIEGVHFLRDKHPPESVGWKCLARALSDLAAMGASPRYFLLSLAFPRELTKTRWLDAFFEGLRRASRRLECVCAGGDTTRSQKILISVTVVGEVRSGRAVQRADAKVGDIICVSGTLGEAQWGLEQLLSSRRPSSVRLKRDLRKHFFPQPRIALGEWLAERQLATAMMDISDGLSTDLRRLCSASGVGAIIDSRKLPSPALPGANARASRKALKLALHGGDDYELLFTVSPKKLRYISRRHRGLPITAIGTVTRSREILLTRDGTRTEPLQPAGWDPFRAG